MLNAAATASVFRVEHTARSSLVAHLTKAIVAGMKLAPKRVLAGAVALVTLGTIGCTSSGSSGSPEPPDTADVAYDGLLGSANENLVGPAFSLATAFSYKGQADESSSLSREIADGEISPNVFQSLGAPPIRALMPRFTRWYIRYAATSMVVAYNPASRYAAQFRAIAAGREPLQNLFLLMAKPRFRLGRLDPGSYAEGRQFIFMLELAAAKYHLPSGIVTKILRGPLDAGAASELYVSPYLDPTLQSGKLDAVGMYRSEAVELHQPYIPLPAGINLGDLTLKDAYARASMTFAGPVTLVGQPIVLYVTVIGTQNHAAADAFVRYLLTPAGRKLYAQAGYTLLTPAAAGDLAAIPASISRELGGSHRAA